MTVPTILFGFIIAILMGTGFHLWRGGPLGKMIMYIFVSILGFWLGQLFAILLQWQFLPVGALQFGFNLLGSVCLLFLSYLLSNKPTTKEQPGTRRINDR